MYLSASRLYHPLGLERCARWTSRTSRRTRSWRSARAAGTRGRTSARGARRRVPPTSGTVPAGAFCIACSSGGPPRSTFDQVVAHRAEHSKHLKSCRRHPHTPSGRRPRDREVDLAALAEERDHFAHTSQRLAEQITRTQAAEDTALACVAPTPAAHPISTGFGRHSDPDSRDPNAVLLKQDASEDYMR